MRVLITNNRLDFRGGAESFVGDLARGLQARGHRVVAYSSEPGQTQRTLERAGIPATTDLFGLDFRPDIIHAQHHMDAMTALASLPGVPAVYHCHGAVWRENPPAHPRILRYLAMSETLRERMMIEGNLAGGDVEVVLNSVDLSRFREVKVVNERPSNVLFYNRYHRPDSVVVAAARAAAESRGLDFETLGYHFGKMTDEPENLLPHYDIVMASGRSAIDAMACGCAVLVVGRSSCAELVRPGNYDRWRAANFSAAANLPPPTVEAIASELARFQPDEVREVTRRIRVDADANRMVDRLVGIYHEVIERHRNHPPDAAAETRAMANYLRQLVPMLKLAEEAQWSQDFSLPKTVALRDLQHQLHRFLLEMEKFP